MFYLSIDSPKEQTVNGILDGDAGIIKLWTDCFNDCFSPSHHATLVEINSDNPLLDIGNRLRG